MTRPLARRAVSVSLLGLAFASTTASAQRFELVEATITSVHQALASGRLTCRTLVQGYLDRIAAYDQAGPALNTIQHLNPRAPELADSLDAVMRAKGRLGRLHCVPVLLKDQVETREMPTSYGSALFKDFVPTRDATIVTRLQAAGAIILAKTTMGEFAARYVGSAFGVVRNAYDPRRNPSGSSGGTGAGVAANFGLVGIGEDTGGSVRGPAAVNGLVGLRPTLQLVSRHGMLPANPTQDTMGPMARSVMDAALLLDVMVGYDPQDPITAYAVGQVPPSYAATLRPDALRGTRIGVLREPMDTAARPGSEDYAKVDVVVNQAIADLRALGATIVDTLTIDSLGTVRDVDNDYETERATDDYLKQHPNAPVKSFKEIMLSGVVTPARARGMMDLVGKTTQDPGYLTVIHRRERLRLAVLKAMADQQLDAIVYPTFNHPPMPIPDDILVNARPADRYGEGDNRALSPAIGFPALTVPAGLSAEGLPVGIEFLGRPFSEARLLSFGYAYEQATHRRRPPTTTAPLQEGR
jgi:Asp-tRNA(Asn)/Glu-tRNA(Gln) amidotransferase A subunit family amidase